MNEIVLDATSWTGREDFYDSILPALGAPDWHGRNLDALNDTLRGGDINRINPPLRIVVRGSQALPAGLKRYLDGLLELAADLQGEGVSVEVSFV